MWARDGDYAYYDSKLLPKAPGLGSHDPLREVVDEAAKHKLPILAYCVVQQGGHFLKAHPEWEMRGADGAFDHHAMSDHRGLARARLALAADHRGLRGCAGTYDTASAAAGLPVGRVGCVVHQLAQGALSLLGNVSAKPTCSLAPTRPRARR